MKNSQQSILLRRLKGALIPLIFFVCLAQQMAASPARIVRIVDSKFYYPQQHVKKGFKMKVKYSGADAFIRSKIDRKAGEKAGDYYVIYDRRKNQVRFDVSSIAPRLAGAVNAILKENKDSIVPRTMRDTLRKYKVKTHKEPPFLKLYAYFDKRKFKKRLPPIIRVEYFLNKKYEVERTHAFLHTGERIDSRWDLVKNKKGKFMISKNTIVIMLRQGRLVQQNIYQYTQIKGVYLPKKITMKSKFESGKAKTETMVFSDHQIL